MNFRQSARKDYDANVKKLVNVYFKTPFLYFKSNWLTCLRILSLSLVIYIQYLLLFYFELRITLTFSNDIYSKPSVFYISTHLKCIILPAALILVKGQSKITYVPVTLINCESHWKGTIINLGLFLEKDKLYKSAGQITAY